MEKKITLKLDRIIDLLERIATAAEWPIEHKLSTEGFELPPEVAEQL